LSFNSKYGGAGRGYGGGGRIRLYLGHVVLDILGLCIWAK